MSNNQKAEEKVYRKIYEQPSNNYDEVVKTEPGAHQKAERQQVKLQQEKFKLNVRHEGNEAVVQASQRGCAVSALGDPLQDLMAQNPQQPGLISELTLF